MASVAKSRTARLFAAIWLPELQRAELAQALAVSLSQPADPSIAASLGGASLRPTRPDTWHITLAFVGEAPVTRTVDRFRALVPKDAQAGPLQLAGSGNFGPVVWVGVSSGPWLAEFADALQSQLHVADRRFRAHVTVARVRGDRRVATTAAARAAETLAHWEGTPWFPTEAVLVESVLGPTPSYPVLERVPLSS